MKKIIISTLAVLTALSIALPVFADNDNGKHKKEAHDLGSTLEVHIDDNGNTLVRGAKVASVSGATINAVTTWGSVMLNWAVNTDSATSWVRRSGGQSMLSEVSVGDYISFQGPLVTTNAGLTVNAKVIKNWSVKKISGTLNGTVQSVGTNTFMLAVNGRGNVNVIVASNTLIMKGDAAGVFADIVVGSNVQAKGVWDMQANTLAAEKIVIKVPKPEARIFEGKLKSIAGTTAPTTMVVTSGNVDYTVTVAANISILNNLWLSTSLANFRVGDNIRLYGVANGTTITASVVRDTSILL